MNEKISKRIIVVIGAGRTGTSLLMQILQTLGMNISEEITVPSVQNQKGGYEDIEIFKLQSEILNILNTNQLLPLPDKWLDNNEVLAKRDKLSTIILKNISNASSIWGVKDPRTALLLPLWTRVFNLNKIVPTYFLAIRSPESTICSLKNQYNQNESISELFWLYKNYSALTYTGTNCFIVHYEDWFSKPIELGLEILEYSGLNSYFNGILEESLSRIIKPNLNRSIFQEYEIKNQYVSLLYNVLKSCRGSHFERDKLIEVMKECNRAIEGFKGWYMEAHRYITLHSKAKNRTKETSDHKNGKIKYETLLNDNKKLVSDYNKILKDNNELKFENESLKKNLSSLKHNIETYKIRINQYKENIKTYKIRINQYKENIKKHKDKLQQINEKLIFKDKKNDNWKNQIEAIKNSFSFRLGNVLLSSIKKPGTNTILMPYRIIELFIEKMTLLFNRKRI